MQIIPDRGYALRKRSYKRKRVKKEPSIKLTLPDGREITVTGEREVERIMQILGASLNLETSTVPGRAGTGPPAITPDAPV